MGVTRQRTNMGVNLISKRRRSSSSIDSSYPIPSFKIEQGNPDPKNFKILQGYEIGNYTIVEIEYPGCNNFEGKKILVYKGITLNGLLGQRILDPHFAKTPNAPSPIARFKPDIGIDLARKFVKALNDET